MSSFPFWHFVLFVFASGLTDNFKTSYIDGVLFILSKAGQGTAHNYAQNNDPFHVRIFKLIFLKFYSHASDQNLIIIIGRFDPRSFLNKANSFSEKSSAAFVLTALQIRRIIFLITCKCQSLI